MQIKQHYTSPYSNKRYTGRFDTGKYLLDIKDSFTQSEPPDEYEQIVLNFDNKMKDYERGFIKSNKTKYNLELGTQVVTRGALGGAIGYILLGGGVLGPALGTAAGVTAGVLFGWDKVSSESKGKVEVNIDGQKFRSPYYLDPYSYKKIPELEKALTGSYDVVYAMEEKSSKLKDGEIDRDKLKRLKPYADKLVNLGKSRRLVADFGDKTKHKKEALHVVDSNMAKDLISAGKTVFVVNGSKVRETPHSYKAVAGNSAQTTLIQESHKFTEKQIDYSLTEIKNPEDLAGIKDGKGVPEGLQGLYKNEKTYKETVYAKSKQGSGQIYENGNKTSYDSLEKSRIDNFDIDTESVDVHVNQYLDYSRVIGLIGSIGTFTAATMLGAGPQAAGLSLIGGGVGGYLAGKRLMRSNKFSSLFKMG